MFMHRAKAIESMNRKVCWKLLERVASLACIMIETKQNVPNHSAKKVPPSV